MKQKPFVSFRLFISNRILSLHFDRRQKPEVCTQRINSGRVNKFFNLFFPWNVLMEHAAVDQQIRKH